MALSFSLCLSVPCLYLSSSLIDCLQRCFPRCLALSLTPSLPLSPSLCLCDCLSPSCKCNARASCAHTSSFHECSGGLRASTSWLTNSGGGIGGKQEFSTFSRSFSTVLDGMANGLDYPLLLSANPVCSPSRVPLSLSCCSAQTLACTAALSGTLSVSPPRSRTERRP